MVVLGRVRFLLSEVPLHGTGLSRIVEALCQLSLATYGTPTPFACFFAFPCAKPARIILSPELVAVETCLKLSGKLSKVKWEFF